MSEDSPRRHSRGKQPVSYRLQDEYAFLDEEDSASSVAQSSDAQEESSDDSDTFKPDGQEEGREEDLDDEIDLDDESVEDEDDELLDQYATPSRNTTRGPRNVDASTSQDEHTPKSDRRRRELDATSSLHLFPSRSKLDLRNAEGDPLRLRGVAEFIKAGGQELRMLDLFGPEKEDLKPILASRDYWYTQEAFPLREPDMLRRSFFETAGTREKEATVLRTWYVEGGQDAIKRGQKTKELGLDEGNQYLATAGSDFVNVLWGNLDDPRMSSLKEGSYLDLSEPWADNKDRPGWLFNLGSRVHEAQWAPNEEGSTQYLAVAVEQEPPDRQPKLMEEPEAPAFTATRPYPTSIQIWSFQGNDVGRLDTSRKPQLDLVVCTDWGAPKQFRWCPYRALNEEDLLDGENIHVGLLAGIWSDGHVRILEVFLPKRGSSSTSPAYLHYSQAALDIYFPSCLPTCLHWLSGISFAVGTSSGTVGIWTLSRPGTFLPSPQTPRPWWYQQLADTFVLTISSGWPSQPHLLSITIADGFARLIDMRSPRGDATNSIRGRTLCLSQAWHEQTQSFAMVDEQYMVKHNPIRRFYHNLYSMRLDSPITRVATSTVHPGLLVGSADGTIEACNPVSRIANYKVFPWQQKWFVHEWRRPVDQLALQDGGTIISNSQSTHVPQDVLSQPLVRFTGGYKASQPGIQHSVFSKKATNPEVGKGITVFEEQSAITALAWNPNLKFGAWAVAGMGSGILRVEDISV